MIGPDLPADVWRSVLGVIRRQYKYNLKRASDRETTAPNSARLDAERAARLEMALISLENALVRQGLVEENR